jgi:hypothetical protein
MSGIVIFHCSSALCRGTAVQDELLVSLGRLASFTLTLWVLRINPNDSFLQNTKTYNDQYPNVTTCFGPFLDDPQSNI